jgi:threonine/homoserine/homoserine lactone efflux protein
MFGIQNLPLFIVAGLLLNITPGPDSLLIMTRSASQGWRAGSAAAWGVGAGIMIHVVAAALGLSALLASSATAFSAIKLIGAAYLLYLGVSLLRSKGATQELAQVAPLSYRRIFMQGFWSNVLNPKIALFFLAFVPQFIAHDAPNKAVAFIVLGAVFDFNGMLWCNFLAVFTALASKRLRLAKGLTLWLNRSIGMVLIGFGLKLALAEK